MRRDPRSLRGMLAALLATAILLVSSAEGSHLRANVTLTEDGNKDYHIVLNEGESVLLECEDQEMEHSWKLPDNSDLTGYDPVDFRTRVVNEDGDEWTKGILLKNAKVTDTGLYRCEDAKGELKDEVYVYVKSSSFFLRSTVEGFSAGDQFTVPCRTSAPLQEGQQVILKVDGKRWKSADKLYDSRKGFEMTSKAMEEKITKGVGFECVLAGKEDVSMYYFVKPKKVDNGGSPPELFWEEPMKWPYVGAPYQLECKLEQLPEIIDAYKMYLNVSCPRCGELPVAKKRLTQVIRRIINITELTPEDSGEYTCMWYKEGRDAEEGAGYTLHGTIHKKLEVAPKRHQIKLNSQSEVPLTLKERQSVELVANFSVYPDENTAYSSKWIRRYRSVLRGTDDVTEPVVDDQFHTVHSSNSKGFYIEKLTINKMQTNMSGEYVLTVTHSDTVRTVNWTVKIESSDVAPRIIVSSPNSLSFFDQEFYSTGSKIKILCLVESYPHAKITFSKKEAGARTWEEVEDFTTLEGTFESVAAVNLTAINHVEFKCEGVNGSKRRSAFHKIHVSDSQPMVHPSKVKPDSATDKEDQETIYEGDDVTLECIVPSEDNWSMEWRFRDQVLPETDKQNVGHMQHLFAKLRKVTTANTGEYICIVTNTKDGQKRKLPSKITVVSVQKPALLESSPSSYADWGSEKTLSCSFSGTPTPSISWYKKGKEGEIEEVGTGHGREIREEGRELKFAKLTTEDDGDYECRGANRAGVDSAPMKLTVEGAPNVFSTTQKVGIAIFFIMLAIVIGVYIRLYFGQKKKSNEQQRSLALLYDQLMKGSTQTPLVPEGKELLDTRAQRTAYNPKYEIDEKCLVLDANSLGEGNFGYVKRGQLYMRPASVADRGEPLLVAVKKAKRSMEGALQMLMQELKILITLDEYASGDPNPNVLALVGASTSKFKKGDLTVVFELCELGDLKNYLLACRNRFIDELVDEPAEAGGDYLQPDNQRMIRYKSEANPDWQGDFAKMRREDAETEQLLPERRDTIGTSDLISFSMQVANGMDYLASIPCIHRDLAARNVLITKNRVAKVADFGLTKIDPKNYYRVDKNKMLPIKSLALEALQTQKFTLETDVWSFGILLHEIFTLGNDPYPGHNFDQSQMTAYLAKGERMEKPPYCHPEIYKYMRRSWDEDPANRPTFGQWHSFLREHLKIASPQLLRQSEDEMRKAARQLANFTLYRGEGQPQHLEDSDVVAALNGRAPSRAADVETGERYQIHNFPR